MPVETATFTSILDEFVGAFEQDTRNNGKKFYKIKDNAPAWLQGSDVMLAIHQALDDRFPDDWVYETTVAIAETLTGYDLDDADAARERIHEVADGLVDVYNADRSTWLASHILNAYLVDEAVAEFGDIGDTFERIGAGQYLAIDRIVHAVIQAIEDESEARE